MARRSRPALLIACALLGGLVVVAVRSTPADPDVRLPRQFRLVGLIHREQSQTRRLREEADALRDRLDAIRRDSASRHAGAAAGETRLAEVQQVAGLGAVAGRGLKVTLDDSSDKQSPTGNVNDLVIHSQDVQAVVNALWRAGAEAVAINGQRLVSTSAVLCVGNTLLLNGTIHSPPYVVAGIGASKDRFDADPLVKQLKADALKFGLRVAVTRETSLELRRRPSPLTASATPPRRSSIRCSHRSCT